MQLGQAVLAVAGTYVCANMHALFKALPVLLATPALLCCMGQVLFSVEDC